ncbi:MAG: hypothetical protein GXP26_14015 [Planctomycetes bacterium]|nr:hypothetical protein [Planctomycetota bacterium]
MNSQLSRILLSFSCLLCVGVLGELRVCGAAETATGLLVLRNGNVIEGRITRLADHFRIEVEHGQLQVRVEQAEMFCLTLDEAYERRREMRTGSTADSHLELAAWCLRHDLLDHAARELLEARTVDPNHRKLLLFERRLNHAMKQKAKTPKLPRAEKVAPATPEVDLSTFEQTPQWARALFVRKIQPMLVKSCATAGCHQAESTNQLQLNRLAVAGAGHPETTKHNLVSVLKLIDFQKASESSLLRLADTTHGAGASKPLLPHQLEMLRAWVEQMAMPAPANNQADLVARASQSSVARLGDTYRRARDISALRIKTQQADHAQTDPFDPGAFNRRHSPRVSGGGHAPKNLPVSDSESLPAK